MANIKDKIKKLLALGASPNEHEAKAALLKARELMIEHKLTEDDFNIEEHKLKKYVCNNIKWTSDSGKSWMVDLAQILGDNYCCSCSWSNERGRRTYVLVIAGIGDDADICKDVITYAVEFIESTIKHLQRKRPSSESKAVSNSYAIGFISGLKLAFEEQKEEHPEWGLVVVKPEEVNEYEKQLGTRNVKTKKANFDPLAYVRGQMDGKNFNPQKILNG